MIGRISFVATARIDGSARSSARMAMTSASIALALAGCSALEEALGSTEQTPSAQEEHSAKLEPSQAPSKSAVRADSETPLAPDRGAAAQANPSPDMNSSITHIGPSLDRAAKRRAAVHSASAEPNRVARAARRARRPASAQTSSAVGQPRKAKADPKLQEVHSLKLTRLSIATSIEEREPVGASSEFQANPERLFAFLQVRNDRTEDVRVVVTFEHSSGLVTGNATLTVPPDQPRWRTWASSRNIRRTGTWTAVVKTEDGSTLGTLPFQVGTAESNAS
ncbi:MAG: DUF2914 domain-containing protein [Myxococcota bacterium]